MRTFLLLALTAAVIAFAVTACKSTPVKPDSNVADPTSDIGRAGGGD